MNITDLCLAISSIPIQCDATSMKVLERDSQFRVKRIRVEPLLVETHKA